MTIFNDIRKLIITITDFIHVALRISCADVLHGRVIFAIAVILSMLYGNDLQAQCTRTIPVSDNAGLGTALSNAQPGDCIVLANGIYSGFTITKDGTASNPIIIRAANQGGATVSSGIIRYIGTDFVTIDGLKITTTGATINVDGKDRRIIVSFLDANNCRITNCDFKPTTLSGNTNWVMLNGNSNNNRVDHNEFGPSPIQDVHYVWPCGNDVITGVTKPVDRTPWAEGNGPFNPRMARNTRIDHNHFRAIAAGDGGEAIVLGGVGMTGDYQMLGSIVEANLFEDCSGDSEVISIKSSGNFIRYNTMRRCKASIVSRAGNQNTIEGNFIFGEGVSGTGGIRFYEKDHVIFNNYIETVSPALLMANGDLYTKEGFSHAQTFRAKIIHNTFISSSGGAVNLSYSAHLEKPVAPVFANNIVRSTGGECVAGETGPSNPTYSQNIVSPTGAGTPGVSGSGWLIQDALLTRQGELLKLTSGSPAINNANTSFYSFVTDDADGHLRNDPDIGSDELSGAMITRKPLTANDVGPGTPNMPPTVSITSPANGATFMAPATVVINAEAFTPNASIFKVEFFQGATKLGEDTTSPYSFTWSNVVAGSYTLTAMATDNTGATATSSSRAIVVEAAGVTNLTAVHDAYVRSGANAGITHGTTDPANLITKVAPAAQVDNSRETYLKFDLNSISSPITSVQLRVFGRIEDATVTNIPVGVFSVANTTWSESTLTWNNKPAPAGTALRSSTVTDATARYYTWDITSYVQSEVAAGRKLISLAMKSGAEHNPRIMWSSKETGSNPPQLTIVTSANVNPTVSITEPANNKVFPAPGSVTISAQAADSDGTIAKVEFYSGTAKLGEDPSAPYSFTWNGVSAGTYTLTAVAIDNSGGSTASAPVNIRVNSPPVLSFTLNPLRDVYFSPATITVQVNTTDNDGTVVRTDFWLNNVKIGEDTSPPFSFVLSNLSPGSYTLRVAATDNDGGFTMSPNYVFLVQNPVPAVNITSPANGATFAAPATVELTATASDANGTVSKVEFFEGSNKLGEDLSAPFSFTWTNVPAGTYSLTAIATDNEGATGTSSAVSVTVGDGGAPTVAITFPADSAVYIFPAIITITADASAAAGRNITKVEFFNGAAKISEDLTSPYSVTWNPNPNTHFLTAKATDNTGAVTTSSVVRVIVKPSPNEKVDFLPVHDAYVRDGTNAAVTHGTTDPALLITKLSPAGQLNNNRESYLTFDLSSITGRLSTVILKVYGSIEGTMDTEIPVSVYAVPNTSWSESTITWNNKPTSSASALASNIVTEYTPRYYEFDVTNYVKAEKAAGRTTVSFALKSSRAHNPRIVWNSKEATSNPPKLSVAADVVDNNSPSVSISSPASGANFTADDEIPVIASASDSDGSISRVAFYVDGFKVSDDTTSPYSILLLGRSGTHTLSAQAFDNAGASTMSVGVVIVVNPAPPCGVTASADDGNVAANVLDNDFNTRWSANGDGQWIQVCTMGTVSLSSLQIAFYKGNERTSRFDIHVSTDGVYFPAAATGLVSSGTSLGLETFTFPAKAAKYIRIIGHGNNLNLWNSYTEVRINGGTSALTVASGNLSDESPITCYPNPADGLVTIRYVVKNKGRVQLSLYNPAGDQTTSIIQGYREVGTYQTVFNTHDLPNGIHVIKLIQNGNLNIYKLLKHK